MALPDKFLNRFRTSDGARVFARVVGTVHSIHMASMINHIIVRTDIESKKTSNALRIHRFPKLPIENNPLIWTTAVMLKRIRPLAVEAEETNTINLLKASTRGPPIKVCQKDTEHNTRRHQFGYLLNEIDSNVGIKGYVIFIKPFSKLKSVTYGTKQLKRASRLE